MQVDFANLGELLTTAFPHLDSIQPLRALGDGFSSIAVETAGGIVFRIPKNKDAGQRFAKEARILPQLNQLLSISIPNPQVHIAKAEGLPFGAIGYPKLVGQPLVWELVANANLSLLAEQIANFLIELHGLVPTAIEGLPTSSPEDQQTQYSTLWNAVKTSLEYDLSTTEYLHIVAWWEHFLSNEKLFEGERAVIHGDLWYENLLGDEGLKRLVGVLDWENMAINDPALDFVPQFYLGDDFAQNVMAHYKQGGGKVEAKLLTRIAYLRIVREFEGLFYAIKYEDVAEYRDAIEKIRARGI